MKRVEAIHFLRTFTLALSLCCLGYLLLFYLQFGASLVAEWWVRDVYWVKDSIAARIEGKKLLIVSGSNSLFGIDGEVLETKTGLPVVNMAGHGALDLDFYRFKIEQVVGVGDTVVMPLESEYYSRSSPHSEWFMRNMTAWGKDYFFSLSFADTIRFLFHVDPERVIAGVWAKLFPKEVDERKHASKDNVLLSVGQIWENNGERWNGYSYKSLDRYGGIKAKSAPTRHALYEISSYREYFHHVEVSRYFVEKFLEIKALVEEKGARLYLIWPVTGKNRKFNLFDAGEQQSLVAFAAQLQENGIDIHCNPASFYFHKDMFFNTGYHLNSLGAKVRTENLAACLADIDDNAFHGSYDFHAILEKVEKQERQVKRDQMAAEKSP